MGKHAQLVIGPAGCGKSTFCHLIQEHCDATKRTVHIVNLDPAAEHFSYRPTLDIRDLVSVDDVMEELDLGPNGALVYCLEYLLETAEWLEEELDGYGPDDYLLFDCPGQIELYTHLPVFRQLVNGVLRKFDYSVCCVNIIDSQFIADASKFLSASLVSLSAMMSLELPHINVLSKVDILKRTLPKRERKKALDRFLDMDVAGLIARVKPVTEKHMRLTDAIGSLLQDFNMVSYVPLDASDPDSVSLVLSQIDHAIQYGEDVEPTEPEDHDVD
jgi:GTPase SAR1 family protein